MLRRFEKCIRRLSIFLRDGLRDARDAQKEKVGGGTEFLWGRKAWRVGLVGRGNFTLLDYLPPRYKVCMIERERDFIFILLFTFYFYLFLFFLFKRLQSDTDVLSPK